MVGLGAGASGCLGRNCISKKKVVARRSRSDLFPHDVHGASGSVKAVREAVEITAEGWTPTCLFEEGSHYGQRKRSGPPDGNGRSDECW